MYESGQVHVISLVGHSTNYTVATFAGVSSATNGDLPHCVTTTGRTPINNTHVCFCCHSSATTTNKTDSLTVMDVPQTCTLSIRTRVVLRMSASISSNHANLARQGWLLLVTSVPAVTTTCTSPFKTPLAEPLQSLARSVVGFRSCDIILGDVSHTLVVLIAMFGIYT